MLGQCGPRVPRLKSLFSSLRYSDEVSNHHHDRQAELQFIWQEIGDDKNRKLEELQQLVSVAVHNIYDRALEENTRRKADLEDMVVKSETRLQELLGPKTLQVMASRDLPLQVRLDINMTQIEAVESSRFDNNNWVGELFVMVELRHWIAALREMLRLPPCDSADLDQVLANTTKDLLTLCPRTGALDSSVVLPRSRQKSTFEQMYQFYQTLCTVENIWELSLAKKDDKMVHDILQFSETPVRQCLQNELRDVIARKYLSSNTSLKCSSSKIRSSHRESRHARVCSDDALALEQLSNKILRKLKKINKQAKSAFPPSADSFHPLSPNSRGTGSTSSRHTASFRDSMQNSVSVFLLSENEATTPTSVLLESQTVTPMPGYDTDNQSETLNACWAAEYANDSHGRKLKEANPSYQSCRSHEKPKRLSNLFLASNCYYCEEESQESVDPNLPTNVCLTSNQHECRSSSSEKLSTGPTKINHMAHLVSEKVIAPMSNTPPRILTPSSAPPPVPPPPPPLPPPAPSPFPRVKTTQSSKSTKLKKSPTLSRLHLEMKKKIEGATSSQPSSADSAVQRRTTMGHGSREGMAEALAEITRRSAFFKKIEDDVHKHAKSILMVKSRLEVFETSDMHQLLGFHAELEAHLEHLTDESQVLARFQGFPIKKLEAVRAAASLHLKLRSLLQQTENWSIEPPMSDQMEKVNAFFDRVKTDVEAIERTRDEDCKRFSCQKIHFNFETITLIKEASVGLSSRCLVLTLAESESIKASTKKSEAEYLRVKDTTKLRGSFQMLYKAFQLAFRVHNFAGGHDDEAEQLSLEVALDMETYPRSFWLELIK